MAFLDLRRILMEMLPSPAMVKQAEVLRIQTQMEEIRRPLWAINAVIFDAHLRAMAFKEQDLDDWLADVGAAMVDLDDLLASIIDRQDRAVESGRSLSRSSSLLPARLAFRVVILRKLKKMGHILNGLVERGYAFDLRKEPMDSMDPLQDGYSAILEEVKGRRAEYKQIMEHLQQQEEMHSATKDEEYSSEEMDAPFRIVINGEEGWTLARMIYQDEWVRQHFRHRFWVDAYNFYSGDVVGMGREIARAMAGHGNYSEGSSLQEMWVFVDRQLAGRGYLLVLDGYDSFSSYGHLKLEEKWNELKHMLHRVGGPGSTIIAAGILFFPIPGEFNWRVERLSNNDWTELFMRWAFAYNRPDQDKHKEEEDMAREMAMQIYRNYRSDPFSAKTVGSVFRYIEISRWQKIVKSGDLEKIVNHEHNLITLYLDHHRFSSIIFHRSLFMDDDEDEDDDGDDEDEDDNNNNIDNNIFLLEDFMHLLIAEGHLPLLSNKDLRLNYMNMITHRYRFRYKNGLKDIKTQDYFTINFGKDSLVIPRQCQHLCLRFSSNASTTTVSILPQFEKNKLRTLILRCSKEYIILKDPKYKIPTILEGTFAYLTHLHTLYLQGSSKVQHLLSAIGRLHNLRYLNLSYTNIHTFSRSLCNLQNLYILNLAHCQDLEKLSGQIHRLGRLQILKLAYCEKLQMLPATITNLANLQELDLEGCPWLVQLPHGFTNLKRLVELNMHNCVSLTQMPREISTLTNLLRLSGFHANDKFGSALAELQNLVNLIELRVETLEQVWRSKEIITCLGLQKKINLSYLMLHWQWWNVDLDSQAMVDLEASSWQELEILENDLKLSKAGAGVYSKVSIEQHVQQLEDLQPYLPNLKKLEIISYMGNKWPSWMQDVSLSKSLAEIRLINLKKCKTPPPLAELKNLEIIEISGMDFIDIKYIFECAKKFTLSEMPKIENLSITSKYTLNVNIIRCPKLRANLSLYNCKELNLWLNNEMIFISEFESWDNLSNIKKLEIVGCQELKFLTKYPFDYNLRRLTIISCNNLITLPICMGGERFYRLKSLEICNCSVLISIPAIPKRLKQITIQGCPKLQLLPDLPSRLRGRIIIQGCPKLQLPLRFKH